MRKNVIWNTVGSIFYCACQWLITIIVVRVSTYEDAGYLSLAMTTSSSFSAISLFSMRNFQVSDIKNEYSSAIYTGSRILTSLLAFALCILVSVWGNSLYQILCIAAFMLVRVAEAIVDVMHGIDQKHERYDYIGKSYIYRGITTVVSFTLVEVLLHDLLASLFIMAALNLLIAFLYDWRKTHSLEYFVPVIKDKGVAELLKKCIPIVIFTFVLSLETLLPKNLLQMKYGAEALGIYSSISSPTLVVQVFASVVFTPFLPMVSQVYVNRDMMKFRKMLHRIYLMLAILGVVVTIGAMLFGKIGLKILLREDILQYYDLFMPIVWCTILTAGIWVMSAIMTAMRELKILLIGIIGDFALCLITMGYFVGTYEKNGVSLVQLLVFAINIIYMMIMFEKIVKRQMGKGVIEGHG